MNRLLYTVAEKSFKKEKEQWTNILGRNKTKYEHSTLKGCCGICKKNCIIQSKERKKIKYREELAEEC